MLDLAAVMGELADRITAAGVPAVIDERDMNPPCCLIRPPTLSWRFAGGRYDAQWTAVVVVPSAGRLAALGQLGQLAEAVAAGVRSPVVTATPTDVYLTDGSAPVPGLEIAWTSKIVTTS